MKSPILLIIWANPDRYPPTVNAANYLAENGYEVVLIGRSGWTAETKNGVYSQGVKVLRVPGLGRSRWERVIACGRFLAVCVREGWRLRPSAIIGYDNFGLIGGWLAKIAVRNARLAYHCHDVAQPSSLFSLERLAWIFERTLVGAANAVVFPDAHRARAYAELLRLTIPVTIAPNAPRLHKPKKPIQGLREIAPQLADKRIVIRHGNVGSGHALECTLASMPDWPSDTAFVVIGPGERSFSKMLQEMARDLRVADRFVLIPAIAYPEILNVIADADLGSALYDGLQPLRACAFAGTASNKALEFLATGVPFLVDTHPASAIFVEAGVAIAVDPRDRHQIARAVVQLIEDTSKRAAMGTRAIALHREELNFEHGFAQIEKALGVSRQHRPTKLTDGLC